MKRHPVVANDRWLKARKSLLVKEKKFTRLRDDLSRQRRELPWVKVDKEYIFDSHAGRKSLSDLFGRKSQLIVYHFMFAPEWDEGCKHCSFWADHFDAMGPHLRARDVSFVVIARAPLKKIDAFKKRMGWRFKWVSSGKNDFNYDFNVSFTPRQIKSKKLFYNYENYTEMNISEREGASAFYKDEKGKIFHTYSTFARGIDMLNTTYHFLDISPKGRDEDPDDPQNWVEYHDRYKG